MSKQGIYEPRDAPDLVIAENSEDHYGSVSIMYVEGVRDPKRFPESLKQAADVQPVIVVKGGRKSHLGLDRQYR